jgi:spore germination protein YaaH
LTDDSGSVSSLASSSYVDKAHNNGLKVWGLISDFNYDSDGNYYVNKVVKSTTSRRNLIQNILNEADECGMDGINVDFEAMEGKAVGDGYIQFIRELSIKCENNDIILSVDVPVPASYNDFYQYGEQSNYADYVIVMGYDEHWGQASGEGSVASLNWVNNAVKNALAEGVPADQLVLGIPFYTRLWNLTPTSEGEDAEYIIGFEHLGMEKAKNWMASNVQNPVWLEDCGQWYGETIQNEILYKLWLEDTDSLEKRLELIEEYSLAGAAFWKYGFETKEVWDLIIKYIN